MRVDYSQIYGILFASETNRDAALAPAGGSRMPMKTKERGYTRELMVLPFDHRNSFQEKLFGIHGVPTPEQTKLIASYKNMIYDGFEKAVNSGLPRDKMGILVDEQFGGEVIPRAR